MRLISELVCRFRSLILWRREDAELDEELRFHLEQETRRWVTAGMNERDALILAQRRLGGLERVKDRTRQARGLQCVDELVRNFRYSMRKLLSAQVLSLAAVLTIAAGVALTATVFSVVYGILIRPLPYPDADRLAAVDLIPADGAAGQPQFEALDLRDFRERQTSFESLDGYFQRMVSVTDGEGLVEGVNGTFVTASALDRLGIAPHLGRTFRPGEDFTANIGQVVISYGFWLERYAGSEEIIGTTLVDCGR